MLAPGVSKLRLCPSSCTETYCYGAQKQTQQEAGQTQTNRVMRIQATPTKRLVLFAAIQAKTDNFKTELRSERTDRG